MSFRDTVEKDMASVFLNQEEFGELRTVLYNGERYRDIPVVLSSLKEKDRTQTFRDHAQGLYVISTVLHCMLHSIGGVLPEKGQKLRIYEPGGIFYRDYYIGSSGESLGMVRLELEAVAE